MSDTIANLFQEDRRFPPPPEFAAQATAQPKIYEEAGKDALAFWEREAERLHWNQRWDRVLDDSNPPFFQWFTGGKLNVTESCLDRHLAERGDRVAFYWEGEPGDRRTIT